MHRDRDALLRAVLAAPDDDLPRLVFADWLEEHGEPEQAEFIRVQVELARRPDPALAAREAELLAAHGEEWTAPLRQVGEAGEGSFEVYEVAFRRGFAWGLEIGDEDDEFREYARQLFRLAPVRRIQFFHTHSHENRARCPELRHLRELGVDRCGYEPDVVARLLASPHLGNLVRLEMTADDDNGHLDTEGLRLIGECRNLSGLRELDLSGNWCGWEYDGDDGWVRHLLAGGLVGQLTELRLGSTMMHDEAAEFLAASDRVRNLERLDLSGNYLTDLAAIALAESPHLVNLRELDLRGNIDPDADTTTAFVPVPSVLAALVARFGSGLLLT